MFERAKGFVSYWFLRYLLVTEMYMIERWERVVVRILLQIFVSLFKGLFKRKFENVRLMMLQRFISNTFKYHFLVSTLPTKSVEKGIKNYCVIT